MSRARNEDEQCAEDQREGTELLGDRVPGAAGDESEAIAVDREVGADVQLVDQERHQDRDRQRATVSSTPLKSRSPGRDPARCCPAATGRGVRHERWMPWRGVYRRPPPGRSRDCNGRVTCPVETTRHRDPRKAVPARERPAPAAGPVSVPSRSACRLALSVLIRSAIRVRTSAGKRRVLQLLGHPWASSEIIQARKSRISLAFAGVLVVLLHQQPGEGGDRVGCPCPVHW